MIDIFIPWLCLLFSKYLKKKNKEKEKVPNVNRISVFDEWV